MNVVTENTLDFKIMRSNYTLASVNFTVEGSNEISHLVREELAPIKRRSNEESVIDIEFKFVSKLNPFSQYTKVGDLLVGDNKFQYEKNNLKYQACLEPNGRIQVLIDWNYKKNKLSRLSKFRDLNYLSTAENDAKNFMYNLFDYMTSIVLLKKESSYLHASSISTEGKGIAFIAWGGIGKTTSMLKLVLEKDWRYLSDDLGLIDKNGILWKTPKHLQIYGYNTVGQDPIKRSLLTGRKFADKLSWYMRFYKNGPHKVRRRISADELFSQMKVGNTAKLSQCYFLERWDSNEFQISPISVHVLVEKSSIILLNELKPLADISIAIECTGRETFIPSINDYIIQVKLILKKAFENIQPYLIKIPLGAGPDELSEFIDKHIAKL